MPKKKKSKKNDSLAAFAEGLKDLTIKEEPKDALHYKPVSPRDFFTSMYYSGFQKGDIFDFWVEEAIDFIEGGYNELIITGSLGSGKTTGANLILEYKLYELFAHKNVNDFLGIPRIQDVYNIYFSVSRVQALRTGFSQFRAMVDASKWYQEHYPRNKKIDSVLEFQKAKFNFFSGSSHKHAIGMTVWSFILDEGDFFKKGSVGFDENYDAVTEMYDELVDRRISRFRKNEQDFSFSILISSASYQSSFVEKRIAAAAGDPSIKVIEAVTYKIKPKGTFSEEKFLVFKGDEMIDPEIVYENSTLEAIAKQYKVRFEASPHLSILENYMLFPVQYKQHFEQVPIDFEDAYKRNLHKSLMNHSGVYTARVGKLLRSKSLLTEAYTNKTGHPFTKKLIEISTGDEVEIQDYFLPNLLEYPEKPHAIHIDQSLSTDHMSMSMTRYDGLRRKGNEVMRMYTQVFTLEVAPPPPPYKIKISKTRNFIIFLFEKLNINLVKVTADQFQCQSRGTQVLTKKGLVTIEAIKKGDFVYGREGWNRVKKTFKYNNVPTFKIKTNRGFEFECTPNHRMLASINYSWDRIHTWDWVEVGKMEIDDVLWINTHPVNTECDYQIVPKYVGTGLSRIDKGFSPKVLDENIAELLGYYVGDGSLTRTYMGLILGSEEDKITIDKIIKNILGYSIFLAKRSCSFGGIPFVEWVKNVGFLPLPSHKKHIPEIIMKSPRSVKAAFLRGLYSADGAVSDKTGNEGQVSLASSSKKLIDQVKMLLNMEFGIKTSTSEAKRIYKGDYSTKKRMYHLRLNGEREKFVEIGFSSKEKMSKFMKYSNIKGRITYDRIVSIEKSVSDVYDLEVENNPSYLANGFMSHNSDDGLQIMADHGIPTGRQSIDKSDKPFLAWINCLHDKCYSMYKFQKLEEEALSQVHDRRKQKVHKPDGGSDDCVQSLVGSLYNLVTMDDLYGEGDDEVMNYFLQKDEEKKVRDPNSILTEGKYTDEYIGDVKKKRRKDDFINSLLT